MQTMDYDFYLSPHQGFHSRMHLHLNLKNNSIILDDTSGDVLVFVMLLDKGVFVDSEELKKEDIFENIKIDNDLIWDTEKARFQVTDDALLYYTHTLR